MYQKILATVLLSHLQVELTSLLVPQPFFVTKAGTDKELMEI